MNQRMHKFWLHSLEKNVEENVEEIFRPDQWPIYERYEIIFDGAGKRYIHAPPSRKDAPNEIRDRLHPLSRTSAGLFLRFARWVEETGMDKELDTERNAEAAKLWADTFGVLGLNPIDMFFSNIVYSHRVTADYLGVPELDDAGRRRLNVARGGWPHESVANFTFEAWEAHIAWRLYESVRSGGRLDEASVVQFMSPINQWEADITPEGSGNSWVERDIYSSNPERVREWALTVVTDAVNTKIENHCYPIVQGEPGSYKQSWGFTSLLGAMWLQMMFLMREDRRCWWCGKPLDPGMRSHARFCQDNNGQCKWYWNYNEGSGKSSKEWRRQGRYIR
jgi:hypothetical protein